MSSLQKRINTIINDENTKQNKILLLRKLFIEENIIVFSDFDDTLSASCCVYYTKIKLLKKEGRYTPENRMKLIKNFKINSEFPSNLGKIVILSRWDNLFLEELFFWFFNLPWNYSCWNCRADRCVYLFFKRKKAVSSVLCEIYWRCVWRWRTEVIWRVCFCRKIILASNTNIEN